MLLLLLKLRSEFVFSVVIRRISSCRQCYSSSQNHFSFSFYKVWAQSLQYKFLYSIWILFSSSFYTVFRHHFISVSVSVFTSFQLVFYRLLSNTNAVKLGVPLLGMRGTNGLLKKWGQHYYIILFSPAYHWSQNTWPWMAPHKFSLLRTALSEYLL